MASREPAREWDASTYDRVADPQSRWGRAVLDRLVLAGDETALDAGRGTGGVSELPCARLPRGRVVSVDASRAMLGQARVRLAAHAAHVSFVAADLLALGPTLLGRDAPVDARLLHGDVSLGDRP